MDWKSGKQLPTDLRVARLVLFVLTFFAMTAVSAGQKPPVGQEHAGHEGMSMPMDSAAAAKLEEKILADKRESEFNHHLAGFFVIVAGIFILFQSNLAKKWPAARFVWPACFLLAGLFVLVWSDTELWPFGHRQWLEALQDNREVLQHKTFALLLLLLGAIEWQKARGVLKSAWSNWVFPAVAMVGSMLLIFHQHEGGMVGEHHMETMQRIKYEHMSYLLIGLGIGVTNGLSGLKMRIAGIFSKVWPVLMVTLGVLLMLYKE